MSSSHSPSRVYKLVSVNKVPERAMLLVGNLVEDVKNKYTIVHCANADSELSSSRWRSKRVLQSCYTFKADSEQRLKASHHLFPCTGLTFLWVEFFVSCHSFLRMIIPRLDSVYSPRFSNLHSFSSHLDAPANCRLQF